MKRIINIGAIVLGLFLVLGLLIYFKDKQNPGTIKIGIFQIADHPALDKLREGFQGAVTQSDFFKTHEVKFDFQNAGGDGTKIESIATYFASSDIAIVYAIGTPVAQAVKAKNPKMRIVLGAASDPVSSGLVANWDKPGGVITGTSDFPPVEKQVEMLQKVLPSIKRIGILYNTSEDNSVSVVQRFKTYSIKQGYSVVEKPVASPADIPAAVASLGGLIDAVYVPTDNTVQSGLPALIRGAFDLRIPVFGCDLDSVKKGALYSIGTDYFDIGRVSGQMAVEILGGSDPAMMGIRTGNHQLFFNRKTAAQLKVKLPSELVAIAAEVVEE